MEWKCSTAFAKAGYKYIINPKATSTERDFFCLDTSGLLHLTCGAMSLVYESNQCVSNTPGHPYTELLSHEDIYKSHIVLFQEVYQHLFETFEKRRQNQLKNK